MGLHVYFKNTQFREELQRQFDAFVNTFGFEPSHIDIHKMYHLKEGYPIIQLFCIKNKIPCKNLSKYGKDIMLINKKLITTTDSSFTGTKKSFGEIKKWLSSLENGFHVIVFHPGYYDPESKSSLNREREDDAENCRKIVRILPEYNIQLAHFRDLANSFSH